MLGNRFVGTINKEKSAFVTHRYEKDHLFRLWDGLGFNKILIQRLNEQIKEVWVFYHKADGETVLLKTTPEFVIASGVEWKNQKDLRDSQYILELEKFEKI